MSNQINTVSDGLVVSLEYTLTVAGQVIDASGDAPLEYLQGYNNIIPGLERELAGMELGESKEVLVAAKDAYGEYDAEAFYDIPRAQFPASYRLEVGAPVRVRTRVPLASTKSPRSKWSRNCCMVSSPASLTRMKSWMREFPSSM